MYRYLILLLISWQSFSQVAMLDKAKKLFDEKQYADAEKILKTIKEESPQYAESRYYLGRVAFQKNANDDAQEYFEAAVELDSKKADYHYWLGSTYGRIAGSANKLKQGYLAPKIKSEFEKTVALDPSNLDAHWGLIEFYTQAPGFMGGSWEKAEETAKAILKINKAEGYRALGVVYARQEKYSEAEKAYIEAKKIDISYTTVLGDFYTNQKKFDEAEKVYKEAAKADSKYLPSLGNFYINLKKFDQAFLLFEDVLKKEAGNMRAIYQIGKISAVSGQNLQRGEECLKKYLTYQPAEGEPSHAAANMRLAMIMEKKGLKSDARKLYEEALRQDPQLKEAQLGLDRVK